MHSKPETLLLRCSNLPAYFKYSIRIHLCAYKLNWGEVETLYWFNLFGITNKGVAWIWTNTRNYPSMYTWWTCPVAKQSGRLYVTRTTRTPAFWDTPTARWLHIPVTRIRSKVKTRQSYNLQKLPKIQIANFARHFTRDTLSEVA